MTISGWFNANESALPSRPWSTIVVRFGLILVCTFLALYWRRPDQFFNPTIWAEEASPSLQQYIEHGWGFLLDPVAGYLIFPTKLIQGVALMVSLDHYLAISYWLVVLFHAGVLGAIALSPTTLRMPLVCALFTLMLPTDSEVFGTTLYAFWWGSLLILPPLLWSVQRDLQVWPRVLMVLLGGLSSPLVVAFLPLFILRNFFVRTRNSTIITVLAVVCGAVQLYFVRTADTHGTTVPTSLDFDAVIRKFFGMFVYWSPASDASMPWLSLCLGLLVIVALFASLFMLRTGLRWRHVVLLVGLLASIAISVTRVPPEFTHPFLAGPRYFFYPYVLLGWLLIQFVADTPRRLGLPLSILLLSGLHQVYAYGPRGHHPLNWQQEIDACVAATGEYEMRAHVTGNLKDSWGVKIPPGACKKLREQSLLGH